MSGEPVTVLITGASGSLGEKARAHLATLPNVRMKLFTHRNPRNDPALISADLSVYSENWVHHFDSVDVVLHLAADPQSYASWGSVQKLDIDLLNNVCFACVHKKVKRLVLASSNWILNGYRFSDDRLTPQLEPRPTNPYGAAKVFAERLGKSLSEQFGLSVICLRIGYCAREAPNRPGPHMRFGLWGQQMWLSDADWAYAVERSVLAPNVPFAAVNVVSDNAGMRWSLEEGEQAIGFRPRDSHHPVVTWPIRLRERFVRWRYQRMLAWTGKFGGWDW